MTEWQHMAGLQAPLQTNLHPAHTQQPGCSDSLQVVCSALLLTRQQGDVQRRAVIVIAQVHVGQPGPHRQRCRQLQEVPAHLQQVSVVQRQ